MVTVIRGAETYAPERMGRQDILVEGHRISHLGELTAEAVEALEKVPGTQIIDASGLTAAPGLIDPHVHITGGGGEGGYASRTPEITITDIIGAGVTTVVGCLGTDSVTRSHGNLIAKARGLEEEGITTFVYTGSYQLPARTITGSVVDDIVLIDKVIGAGEIAVSERRSFQPTIEALADIVSQCHVGGLLSGKAGVTHFHVGSHASRLAPLHRLLDEYPIAPPAVYATHITRDDELLADAVDLAAKGAFVDMTAGASTVESVKRYRELGGDLNQLTLSSDANGSLPKFDDRGRLVELAVANQSTLFEQVWACTDSLELDVSQALALVTANTADALRLSHKGRIAPGHDADLLLLDADHSIRHAFALGRQTIRDGQLLVTGTFD
ncbi:MULTISPECIES: beta-aspartyl-peptidase [unclassified Brevibacterium]|uniref:beta-aspartyl-peptidase n=1 Tax=unclassified Brevibacterium TaxID=2614124 RepID=UPI001E3D8014|nr:MULTISPECIES: beta-aspartyl-peptidase [unclassified Brevibacterium]MCD1284312.1 beta-aspartyl-peptidase [Brevibacterium sp. CCUG 69071]MDK8436077.1 beta-aspartyl-peptidase [Brevibacterium sp. H-BE7]